MPKSFLQLTDDEKLQLKEQIHKLYTVGDYTKKELLEMLNISEWTFDKIRNEFNLWPTKAHRDKKAVARMKQGVIDKYGVDNVNKLESTIEHRKQTMVERYGAPTTMQSDELKQKWQQEFKQKYGEITPSKVSKFQQKAVNTLKSRYPVGSEARKKITETVQATCLQRYGTPTPFRDPNILLQQHGTPHPRQCSIDPKVVEIVNDANKFKEAILSIPEETRTLSNISKILHIGYDQVIFWANRYEVRNLITNSVSYLELHMREWLDAHDIRWHRSRKIIPPQEIDLYLPDYNIGIEMNGEHWHCIESGMSIDYHQLKSLEALKHGVFIFHIYEKEFIEDKDHIFALIQNELTQSVTIDPSLSEVILDLDKQNPLPYINEGFEITKIIEPTVQETLESTHTVYNAGQLVLTRRYRKVHKVETIQVNATPVYDIEVPDTHNFVLDNGAIVHNCVDMRQQLITMGFPNVSLISLDRTPDGYMALKSAIAEKRISLLHLTLLERELVQLERDNVTGKLDHPLTGSKDCADGLAGALYNALLHENDIKNDLSDLTAIVVEVNSPQSSVSIPQPQTTKPTAEEIKRTAAEIVEEAKRRATLEYQRTRPQDLDFFGRDDNILL